MLETLGNVETRAAGGSLGFVTGARMMMMAVVVLEVVVDVIPL